MEIHPRDTNYAHQMPIGRLGIIAMKGCEGIAAKVDAYLSAWRAVRENDIEGYRRESYLIMADAPRFGSGEGKGVIRETVRGDDLYIISDVTNHHIRYKMYGEEVPMSPDDHYQDLKRIINATGGTAKRINVVMPFLYESRQHKRSGRESLDCALALQELKDIGVTNIITFDAHDPRVCNAIPMGGFNNMIPTYQFIKAILKTEDDLVLDTEHMIVISPDEGAIGRGIYFATNLDLDVGMFYKRRDYSRVVDGKNPIVAHEFMGTSVEGKDCVVVDDMIASGESVIDVARQLKERKARRVFVCATFGLFTKGMAVFDKAYEAGLIDRIYTTNAIFQSEETLSRPYYASVDLSKYIALIMDNMNHDASLEPLLINYDKIQQRAARYRAHNNKALTE